MYFYMFYIQIVAFIRIKFLIGNFSPKMLSKSLKKKNNNNNKTASFPSPWHYLQQKENILFDPFPKHPKLFPPFQLMLAWRHDPSQYCTAYDRYRIIPEHNRCLGRSKILIYLCLNYCSLSFDCIRLKNEWNKLIKHVRNVRNKFEITRK